MFSIHNETVGTDYPVEQDVEQAALQCGQDMLTLQKECRHMWPQTTSECGLNYRISNTSCLFTPVALTT